MSSHGHDERAAAERVLGALERISGALRPDDADRLAAQLHEPALIFETRFGSDDVLDAARVNAWLAVQTLRKALTQGFGRARKNGMYRPSDLMTLHTDAMDKVKRWQASIAE